VAGEIAIRHVPPRAGAEVGSVVCQVCGLVWTTTPQEDALLGEIFAHWATHVRPAKGAAPSSAEPPISTR
jgi:hypothetical protein